MPHSHMDMRMVPTKKAPRLGAPALIIIECQNSLFWDVPPYWDCPHVVVVEAWLDSTQLGFVVVDFV